MFTQYLTVFLVNLTNTIHVW